MLTRLRAAFVRIRELGARSKIAADRDDEFQFHLEMETEHNQRLGMSPDAARRSALIAFGGSGRFRDEVRDVRGVVILDNVVRDARFALRRLRRSPAFAAGVIATLGIGIGTAIGIGSIVYGVLLRDLPYKNSDELVRVSLVTLGAAGSGDLHSDASYAHLAAGARSFEGFAAYYTNDGINLTVGDEAERLTAGMVTPGAFGMLGVSPVLGHLFAAGDTAWRGSSIPVLIAEELWERRYGRDPNIIGKRIELNRGVREVIGVLPRSFDFPAPDVRVWYPASVNLDRPSLADRYFVVIARLKRGVSVSTAEAELNALLPSLSARFPIITAEAIRQSGAHITVQPLKSVVIAPVRGQLVLLGIVVVVILLTATTNVVNLFLLRAERSATEIAIAQSLGATWGAVAQRFLVEGAVLGAASVVVALPVAAVALATKFGFGPREIPRLHEVTFGITTIALVIVTAVVLGAAIGLTALTRVRTGIGALGDRLRGAGRTTAGRGWRRVQRALVATQIAIALAFVAAAGLLGRSFLNLRRVELGFNPKSTTSFEVALPFAGYSSYGEAVAFHARVVDKLNALPGATGAAAAMLLPLTPSGGPEFAFRLESSDESKPSPVAARSNLATADYFSVMGIPLIRGRSFAAGDLRGEGAAVVVSAKLARDLFGGGDPIGRRVRRAPAPGVTPMTFRVIGVVGDVPGDRIEAGATPTVYFPILRDGDGLPREKFPVPFVPRGVRYVVRSGVQPSPQTIRALTRELDKRVPAVRIQPLGAIVDSAVASVRLTLLLLSVAAGAALLLGIVGVYSVVSYAAAGRLREFGVRLALGATPRGVASIVLHEGAIVAAVGVLIGLGAAFAGTRFLGSLLFEVSATSPLEFGAAALIIAGVTLVATLVPARRASRIDPALVLRGE